MALSIIVTVKQVMDPETPASAFHVDREAKRVVPSPNIPPVMNGFDEQAVEAALRIRESVGEATITVISLGDSFSLDVMKKPLSMGADELLLLQDPTFENTCDSSVAAHLLAIAIRKRGPFDLVLCGRQTSDWDNAQVPLGIAEVLGLPAITIARKVEVLGDKVRVERVLSNGYEVMEAALPALVTVSNELGEPRYPTLRGIMAASKKQPTVWSAQDLGVEPSQMRDRLGVKDLFIPQKQTQCEFIQGEDEADSGRKLALKLREAKLI